MNRCHALIPGLAFPVLAAAFALGLSVLLGLAPSAASATGLRYDIRFSGDSPGSSPATANGDFPREGPSILGLPFVTPPGPNILRVVDRAGTLTDQPLLFDLEPGEVGAAQIGLGDLGGFNDFLAQGICLAEGGEP